MKRHLATLALLAFALCAAPATAQESADALQGYWVSDVTTPRPHGELVLRQNGDAWEARFGDVVGVASTHAGGVKAQFPGGLGAFRGALSRDRRTLDGFWIQDGDQGQPLAMPLTLRRDRRGAWRATAAPLDPRFTLYLRIFRRDDGVLIGAFRNPQRNTRGGGSRLFVERDGAHVLFLENNGGESGIVHEATFAPAPDRIRMLWRETGETLDLVRQPPENVAAYFPRPSGAPPYLYTRPQETGDGWRTARAGSVGFDETALAGVVQHIAASDPAVRQPALIHSLLVARRGRLVLDEYFFGHDGNTLHDLRSAGKTFASVMLGAAMQSGVAISPDTSVASLMHSRAPFATPSPAKDRITLAHLMTHASGLACNDNDEASPGGEDTMQSQTAQPDWWKYTLDLPMQNEPGARYAYCSGGMNLVGGALTAATGAWLPALFDRTVARPLQFGPYAWNLAPDGEGYLGGGSRLRPRDLLKIGQMYLDGGGWRGRRIVSKAWVARSTAPIVTINEQTTGLDTETLHNTYFGGADGYAWHTFDVTVGGRTYREYEAAGNGGQILAVVPELDLAVVLTGGNYNQGFIWGRWRDEIVGGAIIAAIRD
ncbi:MAG: serine hydrolase [Hyphomonadaceae bacterium]|nr:serine hydrolase [Hyphomonadaceae bacterium]